MAEGFGTFTSSTRCSSGGAVVSATLSQSVNASARKVTVTLRVTAAYYRSVNSNWTPGGGVAIYGSDNSSNKVIGKIGSTTTTLKTGGKVGISSVSGKTYKYNGKYTIQNGDVAVRSGYEASWTMSKTYDYNDNGDAISDSWSASMYLPGQGSTTSVLGSSPDSTRSFTTDSISPSYVAPTPTAPNITEITPSTVKGTFAVSSWGGTSAGYIAARLFGPSGNGRLEQQTNGVSSYTTTITNSSVQLDGGTTIKGAGTYYADTYASNSAGGASSSRVTVYTPPAELANITYTEAKNSTNVSITPKITGGSSSVNASGAVSTKYRYAINGTWYGWTTISGTATAWTERTGSAFTCPYGASVKIEAYQTFNTKESVHKTVTFTATNGDAPSNLASSITASTWETVTMSGSCSYGNPSGVSTRSLTVGVNINGSSLANRREKNTQGVTSVSSVLIDNTTNTANLGGDFTLKGMLPVYPYAWASNTVQSASSIGSVYYLPPAPGSASYTDDDNDEYTIRYTGVVANNVTDYTASELTRTVRYKIGSGDWVYIENGTQMALDAVTSETIEILPTQSATVEAWMTYRGKNSAVSTFTISNSNDPVYLYGSVNGEATKIRHFYGSVNGETVKITKLYASVNGVARKVFEDV